MKTLLLTTLALLLSACAAKPPAPTDASQTAQAGKPEPTVICLREANTGTRFIQTRCYTHQAVDERTTQDRAMADRIQTQPHKSMLGGM